MTGNHPHLVAVYGTLKRGECNHHLLLRSPCLGQVRLSRLRLYNLGPYPMAVACADPAAMVAALEKIPWVKQFDFFLERLAALPSAGLTRILLLSALRFVIYTAQYLLLFQLFGVTLNWLTGAALVSLMMLLLALVPTIALAELGFRGQISLRLFSLVSANYAGIMATAAGIWVINLIIPALAGSLLVLGIRIFTKKKR